MHCSPSLRDSALAFFGHTQHRPQRLLFGAAGVGQLLHPQPHASSCGTSVGRQVRFGRRPGEGRGCAAMRFPRARRGLGSGLKNSDCRKGRVRRAPRMRPPIRDARRLRPRVRFDRADKGPDFRAFRDVCRESKKANKNKDLRWLSGPDSNLGMHRAAKVLKCGLEIPKQPRERRDQRRMDAGMPTSVSLRQKTRTAPSKLLG